MRAIKRRRLLDGQGLLQAAAPQALAAVAGPHLHGEVAGLELGRHQEREFSAGVAQDHLGPDAAAGAVGQENALLNCPIVAIISGQWDR